MLRKRLLILLILLCSVGGLVLFARTHSPAPEDRRVPQVALEQYGQHVASLFPTQAVTLDRVERLTELAVRSYTITFRTTRQEIMPAASPQADLQTEYWRHVHTLARGRRPLPHHWNVSG